METNRSKLKNKQHIQSTQKEWPNRIPVDRLLADLLRNLHAGRKKPIMIAVGGPGGTGKTTFARRLAKHLDDSALLQLDDYKTSREERRQARIFGPHPDANRIELIAEHLAALGRGERIEKPIYDQETGSASQTETFHPARWNIVEGEISTYARFLDLCDFTIFIDSDWRTQLATRLGRDLENRNYSPDKAIATFLHSNLREFVEHGAASKQWCDVHLFCQHDYRLVLESVAEPLYENLRVLLPDDVEPLAMEGLTVPVLTPFAENGTISDRAFVEHIDFLSSSGVRRILVGGTSGEFFSITIAERLELLKLALEYFPGSVWLQVGGGPLPEARHLAVEAEKLGADGIFCLPPPYYADAPAEGLIGYFKDIQSVTEKPLILYNFPKHTQNPLTPAILRAVQHFGLKDSSGNLELAGETPCYLFGSNSSIPAAIEAGASGFVSAAANVWPELYAALGRSLSQGDIEEAQRLQSKIDRELSAEDTKHDIPLLKQKLRQRLAGYPTHVRPPMVQV